MALGRKKKKENEGLRLTDKRHPPIAVLSCGLAVLSLGVFAVLCFMSGETDGHSGLEAGIMGLICALISIVGFVMAWISLNQDNIRTLFPTIAAVSHGLLILLYLIVYILGT